MPSLDEALGSAIGQDVSRETVTCLKRHLQLLEKWNKAINLVSPSTIESGWNRHILDSAQLMSCVDISKGKWLDLGTGGGFPGLVCASIARETAPDLKFTFVESDKRKAAFLVNAVRDLNLSAKVVSQRVEELSPLDADVVSARALAPLSELLNYAVPHLCGGGLCLFPKGERFREELAKTKGSWRFKLQEKPSITDPKAVILVLGDIERV